MEFRILGPLEVRDGDRVLELGGPKQRALLAALLLERNRVVPVERLIDALWDEEPTETAAKALQVYVSQLRKLLGKDRLETRPPGYRLRVGDGELDLDRFERLRADARPEEALALWRGPPLPEFANQPFARPEIARLEEARLACLEDRIDADLAAGRHRAHVGELEALVREHPFRERLRGQLMLALYRSGRQAEALEAYQEARTTLVDELGIDPGKPLRELHQAILNQDPSLDLPQREQPVPTVEREQPPPAKPPTPAGATRKTVSAVCARLDLASGSGEPLDPETLGRVTAAAYAAVETAAERHGGTIEGAAGDAVTAVFGLPAVHEDDALRAVRTALEARAALGELAASLPESTVFEFRIGVSTGEVVAGGDARLRLRAAGEPLTRSARLADAAGAGEVVADEATYRLVRDDAVADPVAGGWQIAEVAAQTASSSRLTSPLVGRERERRRLADAFDQAVADRSCQLFTVLGAAGVGKSRLVQEFIAGVGERALVARGRCLPYGEGITYWPLNEAVKEIAGLDDADTPEEARAKLAQSVAGEEDADAVALKVAETIGLAEAAGPPEERVRFVQAFFEAVARTKPLVIVFDDIHWAEPTFLDLVEHLAEWSREAPILLVCLARPELLDVRPGWGGGKLNATTVLLEPLSDQECEVLIQNLVGPAELAEEVETRIAGAAEGNPLFVEEMLAMLIDDGLLVRRDGRWIASRDISAVRVPPTIQALLTARLDQLDPHERAAVECAAVAGKVFQEDAVAELATERDVPAALASLVRKELIRPDRATFGGRTYRFRHLLIRDAAYDSVPKGARARLHERFGRWLARAAGARAAEYDEVIGYHLEQAHRYRAELGSVDEGARALAREAATHLGRAARRAFIRSDGTAGIKLVSRAAALLPPDDPARVELIPNVRVVQGLGEEMRWADRVLTDAVEAAATTGDRRLAAHALVQRGLLRLFTEPEVTAEELIDSAERSIAVFTELGDELGLARAWRLVAQSHYLARRAAACAEASERALEHVRRAGDRFEEQEIVEWLVIALLLGPMPVPEAVRRGEQLLADAGAKPLLQAEITAALAALLALEGRIEDAEELVEKSRAIARDPAESVWVISFWWSFVHVWRGDPAAAERELRPAYEALGELGETTHFSSLSHGLAHALYDQGRYDEAERLTRECEAASGRNDVHSQICWRAIRAKTLARRGALAEADELAREALAFAAASDFYVGHAAALMDYAEVCRLRGDDDGALAAIREARRFYELKGSLAGVARADALLAQRV